MSTALSVHRELATWRIVEAEAVVVHAETSEYFSLNPSGTFLWRLLVEAPRTHEELADELAGRYQRGRDVAGAEVKALLEKLTELGLVAEADSDAGDRPGAPALDLPAPSPAEIELFEPPDIVKFGDLETLILSAE